MLGTPPTAWADMAPQDSYRFAGNKLQKTSTFLWRLCWRYLFSQPVARQLSSAQMSLTSVFGMGTGGPSSQSTPTIYLLLPVHYSTASSLCQVLFSHLLWVGDPWESRTPVCGVRGRRLDHLTNGPFWSALTDSNRGPTD